MKKLILGSLTVLSLGLFSFTMPKPAEGHVWKQPDGNYLIEQGACLNFQPADQQAVQQLVSVIYSIPVGTPAELTMSSNGGDPACTGGSVIDKYIFEFLIYTKFSKWDNCNIMAGTNEYELLQVIDRYSTPIR
jgi:hypothetical protein